MLLVHKSGSRNLCISFIETQKLSLNRICCYLPHILIVLFFSQGIYYWRCRHMRVSKDNMLLSLKSLLFYTGPTITYYSFTHFTRTKCDGILLVQELCISCSRGTCASGDATVYRDDKCQTTFQNPILPLSFNDAYLQTYWDCTVRFPRPSTQEEARVGWYIICGDADVSI